MFTPVFKSADPEFNYRAAKLASDLVLAMDEEEARSFTTMVVTDILWDDIEKNEKSLQRHLNSVVSKRLERVQKAADRIVSKKADGFTGALEEISKATKNPYDYGYVFNESDFARDPGTGRFRTKVRIVSDKPVKNKIARATPNMPDTSRLKGLSDREKAHYQQGYKQIADFLDTVQQSGLAADSKIYATIRENEPNGRAYVTEVSGTQVPKIDPKTEHFVGIEARPTSLRVGGASFGLVSALGGGTHRAGQVGATAQAVDDNTRSFADDWTSAGVDNPTSSNARLYGRVEAGSRFLGQVAPAGSKLQMAAAFGEFVGRQGPQAERVLGPRARTTLYRYRGTEKTPDKELTEPYNQARTGGYSFDNLSPDNQQKVRALQRSAVTRYKNQHGGKITPEEAEQVRQVVLRRQFGVSQRDAAEAAEAGRTRAFQAAQAYLATKVPDSKLYDLQLKSGHTPPSEGVIIDKNGKIVTQAIGYGDDHYLPFNLKNLRGLRGGEYIRTRSVGGPTTEDIYTGLVSGAHRLTVVSRSGTFTITFDDTFRGTRRYNDKAGRMVNRYGKLLDAIKSEQVERQPLDPEVRGQIAADVENEIGSFSSPRQIRNEIQRRETEYKENPFLTRTEEAEIDRRVADIPDERQRNQARAEMRNNRLETKAFNFRLNGDGYAAAINALAEQFPYYLSSTHRPTREGRYEGAMDRGYVKPRFNRPSGALEGYYDPSINGAVGTDASGNSTGKYSADRGDYQNSRGRLSRIAEAPAEVPAAKAPEEAPAAVAAPPTPQEILQDRIATAEARQTLIDRAAALHAKVVTGTATNVEGRGEMAEVLAMEPEQFRTWIASPANQVKWDQMVERNVRPNAGPLGAEEVLRNYVTAKGEAGGQKFNRTNHMMSVPDTPYSFDGAPYLHGGNVDKKQQELQRVANRSQVPGFGSLANLEFDDDFKEALRTAQRMRVISDQMREVPEDERPSFLRDLIKNDPTVADMSAEQHRLLSQPEKVDQMIEDVNRAWSLRKLIGEVPKLSTSAGRLEPTGQTIATPPATPAQKAVASVSEQRGPDIRRQARIYHRALYDYSHTIPNMEVAEGLREIADAFDQARHSPVESMDRDFNAANAALMELQRDYPDYSKRISDAIMAQFHKERE
jgi:hypothetical protein